MTKIFSPRAHYLELRPTYLGSESFTRGRAFQARTVEALGTMCAARCRAHKFLTVPTLNTTAPTLLELCTGLTVVCVSLSSLSPNWCFRRSGVCIPWDGC